MVIDVMNCGKIHRYLRKIIIDHNLSYRVYKVEKSEGYLVFRFEATHFPNQVFDYSFNNQGRWINKVLLRIFTYYYRDW